MAIAPEQEGCGLLHGHAERILPSPHLPQSGNTGHRVLRRDGRSLDSTTELAEPFRMALPSFVQHMGVLAAAGLVESEKEGRTRARWLIPGCLQEAEGWLGQQRRLWEVRLEQLDRYLIELDDRKGDAK